MGFFKPDTVQTRGLLCQTSIILTKITSEDQVSTIRWYSTGLLMTVLKPFTIKKSSLLCLMQVNVYKPPTTNTLTHKITFTWLTYFRSICFCLPLTLSKPVTDQRPILLCQLKVILSSCTSVCYTHHSHVSPFFSRDGEKTWHMTQSIFSSNFYWYFCVKICILEQIIATVLFICLSSIKTERSILEFQSTTAPLTEGGLPVHLPTRSHLTDHTDDGVKNIYYTGK